MFCALEKVDRGPTGHDDVRDIRGSSPAPGQDDRGPRRGGKGEAWR